MLSQKAPLFQGADLLLGEEGRTHPRAPNLAVPGAWMGVGGRSIGNDPSVVQRGRCSRHLLNMPKAREWEWQSSRRESSCIVPQLHTEIGYGISQKDWS